MEEGKSVEKKMCSGVEIATAIGTGVIAVAEFPRAVRAIKTIVQDKNDKQ